ncbi:hypothetical protein KFU94_33390 [Chloroflexi bacterium TSY]|nr:hypothetical protein [Chloroflexi bacterium TSY]
MGKGDIPERFFTEQALFPQFDKHGDFTGQCTEETVGLVGMHIAHKTENAPQWIWGTFEHVDNLQVNSLITGTDFLGNEVSLTPSFYDPVCPHCPVNIPPVPDADSKLRTQVTRPIPIDKQTAELNRIAQEILGAEGSVWQYYELIGTQWPTKPNVAPSTPQINGVDDLSPQLPYTTTLVTPPIDSINNKAGGRAYPVYLTNSTMETYFQAGNQGADGQEEGITTPLSSVLSFGTNSLIVHGQITTQTLTISGDDNIIFATESCMGCHSSAGIARGSTIDTDGTKRPVFNGQLSGDFSWLLQQKACWDNPSNTSEDACQAMPPKK